MKTKILAVMTMFFMCAGVSFGASHFFTDGIIPDGMEFTVGYVDYDTDWIDVYNLNFRLEMPFGHNMSLFGEFQFNDYDFDSTYSIGGGAMMRLIEDGGNFPVNVSARASLYYMFEGDWIPSILSLEARGIVSKQFDHAINWTPYGALILHHARTDDDSDTEFEFALGVKTRFNQFGVGIEALFGDVDAFGIFGSFKF